MAKKRPKQSQKAQMKKLRKAKARQKKRQPALRTTVTGIFRKARQFPIFDCQISEDWEGDMGLVQIVVARQQPNDLITYGIYLIDKFCLGLKNTICNANFTLDDYKYDVLEDINQSTHTTLKPCPPELAHQLIYEGIDYAAQFGFKPNKDYKWSRLILEKRGTLEEPYDLTFGKDGKPFFVSGLYDNITAIIAKLEKTAGEGNYEYMVVMGDPPDDEFDDDFFDLIENPED